jgi:hypothetical protein
LSPGRRPRRDTLTRKRCAHTPSDQITAPALSLAALILLAGVSRPLLINARDRRRLVASAGDHLHEERWKMRRLVFYLGVVTVSAVVAQQAAAGPTPKYVSKLYGYSIALPGKSSRWSVAYATKHWTGNSIGGIGSPAIDTFTDLATSRSYLLAARPTKSNLQQWTRFVASARASVCGKPRSLGSSTLGGAPASVATWTCTDGYKVFVITALHAHSGYFMLVASPISIPRTADTTAFNTARRSFRFASA